MLNKSRQKNVGNFWQNIVTVMVGLGKILFVPVCINKVDHLQEKSEKDKRTGAMGIVNSFVHYRFQLS